MVSELFIHQNNWIHHKNRTQAKKIRVSHTKIQRNGSSNRAKSYGGGIPPYKR